MGYWGRGLSHLEDEIQASLAAHGGWRRILEPSTARGPAGVDPRRLHALRQPGVVPVSRPAAHKEEAGGSLMPSLLSAHRSAGQGRPSQKEILLAGAVFEAIRPRLEGKEVVVDVCCAHGLVSLIALAHRAVKRAVLIDRLVRPGMGVMRWAWAKHLPIAGEAEVIQVHNCDFRECLPGVLADLDPGSAVVVASHACGTLTDEILATCWEAGIDFVCMPCCHSDDPASPFNPFKGAVAAAAARLQAGLPAVLDVLRLGWMEGLGYQVDWAEVDSRLSANNRLLMGRAPAGRPRRRSPSPPFDRPRSMSPTAAGPRAWVVGERSPPWRRSLSPVRRRRAPGGLGAGASPASLGWGQRTRARAGPRVARGQSMDLGVRGSKAYGKGVTE